MPAGIDQDTSERELSESPASHPVAAAQLDNTMSLPLGLSQMANLAEAESGFGREGGRVEGCDPLGRLFVCDRFQRPFGVVQGDRAATRVVLQGQAACTHGVKTRCKSRGAGDPVGSCESDICDPNRVLGLAELAGQVSE